MSEPTPAFGKSNYLLMGTAIAVLVIGYLLMSGGGTSDPNVYNPDIFSFRRITLAPIVLIAGYGLGVVAIFHQRKTTA